MDLQFREDFTRIINKMEESGNDYADKKSASWYLQENKGSVLAKEIKATGIETTSKAEISAKTSPTYTEYLKTVAEAIRQEYRAKAESEKWKASFEALRSLSSLEKATRQNT